MSLFNIRDIHGNVQANGEAFKSHDEALQYIEEQEVLDIGMQYFITPANRIKLESFRNEKTFIALYWNTNGSYNVDVRKSNGATSIFYTGRKLEDALNQYCIALSAENKENIYFIKGE